MIMYLYMIDHGNIAHYTPAFPSGQWLMEWITAALAHPLRAAATVDWPHTASGMRSWCTRHSLSISHTYWACSTPLTVEHGHWVCGSGCVWLSGVTTACHLCSHLVWGQLAQWRYSKISRLSCYPIGNYASCLTTCSDTCTWHAVHTTCNILHVHDML